MLTYSTERTCLTNVALIVVDMQNDFCEGGSLAVPMSNNVIKKINQLREKEKSGEVVFSIVVYTRDWHPVDHVSFANTHGLVPFTTVMVGQKSFDLWPIHCVENSTGAQFHSQISRSQSDIVVSKGTNKEEEAYSGFGTVENPTEMCNLLKQNHIEKVFVAGLAYDFCVGETALDARKHGFETIILEDCTKGVLIRSEQQMRNRLDEQGVKHMSLDDIIYSFVAL